MKQNYLAQLRMYSAMFAYYCGGQVLGKVRRMIVAHVLLLATF